MQPELTSFLLIIALPTIAVIVACYRQAARSDKAHSDAERACTPRTQAIRGGTARNPLYGLPKVLKDEESN